MQKFNTLLVFVASMLMLFSAQAQTAITNAPAIPADRSDITTEYVTPEGKPVARPRADRPEGSTQIVLDYGTTSGDPTGFFWSSNARFGTTDTLMTDLFGVTFDSLIDENGVTYNKDNFFSKIDAIRFRMRLRKASPATVTDSVVIQVLESTNADVVWQEVKEYTAPVNGTDDAFVLEEVFPDTVICDNSFSVRIFLLGPTTDTLHFVSTYNPGTCPQTGAAACGTPQSNIPFNSFFGLYLQGMRFGAGLFLDCDSDGMVGPCESYFLQNNDIRVSVTLIDRPLQYTVAATPDNGVGSGTAEITLADNLPVDVVWVSLDGQNPQNIPNGLRAENLAADRLLFGISVDGINCGGTGIQDTVEIPSNVAIEDFASAGISSFDAYPNPANDVLTLALELDRREDVRVRMLSATGKVVFETASNQVQDLRQPINVADLAPGIYMLNVTTSRGTATQRILVN